MKKTFLLLSLCGALFPIATFSAAIVDVSATRSVFADAVTTAAGNQIVSSTAFGLFNQKVTDTSLSADPFAKVTSFQSTNLLTSATNLDLTGAMYARGTGDGAPVHASGYSLVDLFFTLDDQFNVVFSGTYSLVSQTDPIRFPFGLNLDLFRILPSGAQSRIGPNLSGPGDFFWSSVLSPGSYRLVVREGGDLNFPEYVPQSNDATASVYNMHFGVSPVPEPASGTLLAAATLGLYSHRGRRRTE